MEAGDQPGDASGGLEEHFTKQLKMAADGEPGQPKSIKPSQHFLAAPGFPTITSKLAQKIWNLEFVEMDEFLLTNRTKPWISSHQNHYWMKYWEPFTQF